MDELFPDMLISFSIIEVCEFVRKKKEAYFFDKKLRKFWFYGAFKS